MGHTALVTSEAEVLLHEGGLSKEVLLHTLGRVHCNPSDYNVVRLSSVCLDNKS